MNFFLIRDNNNGGMAIRFWEIFYETDLPKSCAIILNFNQSGALPSYPNINKQVIKKNYKGFKNQLIGLAQLLKSAHCTQLIVFGRKTYAISLIARTLLPNNKKKFSIVYLVRNSQSELNIINRLIFEIISPLLSKPRDKVISISKGLLEESQIKTNKALSKVCIYNGIDSYSQKPIISEIPSAIPKLLWVGRMHKQKNFNLFIKSLYLLQKMQINFEAVVYTDNITTKDYPKNLVNFRSWSKVIPYEKFDIFINTSIYEGFGRTIIESLSHSTPVIVTDCPHGPKEILENNDCGWLVPVGSSYSIVKAVVEWINLSTADKVKLRKRSYIAAKKFSHENMIAEYQKILQQL